MLEVTRTYLPPREKYQKYIDAIWDSHVLTNNGPYVKELEERLENYTSCQRVLACSNGTIVLQLALKALGITKKVITTPFSYVATTNAILWEGCEPVFVDINPNDFCIDVNKIESAITDDTQAILATHVYGYPCDVEAIGKIARKHRLKVIYDAANSFGTTWKGKSIFTFGDISTCSFHATKLFHSGEGGALFVNDPVYNDPLSLYRSFGHIYDDYISEGINAKMSEFHAAMGLCVLDDINEIIAQRKKASAWYDLHLKDKYQFRTRIPVDCEYNYAYYPILLRNEAELEQVMARLLAADVRPRRYFYPSLNTLPFLEKNNPCYHSEQTANRILCLPLSHYITETEIMQVSSIINQLN